MLLISVLLGAIFCLSFGTYNVTAETESVVTLGNANWASPNVKGYDQKKEYKNMISYRYSVMTGSYVKNSYYTGKVRSVDEKTLYDAEIWITDGDRRVDTDDVVRPVGDVTLMCCVIKIACEDTSFKICKDDVFTLALVSQGGSAPDKLRTDTDYLIVFESNTSRISTSRYNENTGGSKVDEEPPIINYEGETYLEFKKGDCVPLFLYSATDKIDGDVPVKVVWSENAYNEKYKLNAGKHTATLVAKDKAGNEAKVEIKITVKD